MTDPRATYFSDHSAKARYAESLSDVDQESLSKSRIYEKTDSKLKWVVKFSIDRQKSESKFMLTGKIFY